MMQLIPSIANAWINKKDEINASIKRIENYLIEVNTTKQGENWREDYITSAFRDFSMKFDSEFGGFGTSPKFPSPHNLIFLIRYSKIYKDPNALKMVEITLDNMRLGGIFDHIGLGFHRYSTDKRWFLPHFEKMLYDQAMIAMAYLEAYQLTKKEKYANVANEIFTYVLRDMKYKKGGFFSAEDADSEGEEGTFYVWSKEELIQILGKEKGDKISKIYGFMNGGNFHDEASGQKTGKNIPYLSSNIDSLSKEFQMSKFEIENLLIQSNNELFKARKKREHPLKDDKILTDWNGLMIAALALGGKILNNSDYTNAAINASKFIENNLKDNNNKLLKRYRNGKSGLSPHIDDYAFLTWAMLNLYDNTFELKYLEDAINLTKTMIEDFLDENGGFFIGSKDAEKLMVRTKSSYDGAIPSGNSVAVMNLFRLSKITGDTYFKEIAIRTLKAFSDQVKNSPSGFSHMLSGYMFNQNNTKELVIVAEKMDKALTNILDEIQSVYSPNSVILLKTNSNKKLLSRIAPWTKNHEKKDGKITYYLCENFACKQPTTSLRFIQNSLDSFR